MKFTYAKAESPPHILPADWLNWQWQVRHCLRSAADFGEYFVLNSAEKEAFSAAKFKVQTTPYYASLARGRGVEDPIRKILMPHKQEFSAEGQQMLDPLGEIKHNPVARIIHRYTDRCLFLVTDMCAVYCRYCTRKHFTGQDAVFPDRNEYQQALQYIASQPNLHEVILSGGDPLTLSDDKLERVLFDLQPLENVELVRLATRMPVVNPMRITDGLCSMLKKYKPVFVMTHFNHPREITYEAAEALERLVDHGHPVFNQMVLLNGVNNHANIVRALSRRLLSLRVKPYYMFHCDPSFGTAHFRTSVENSLAIQKELWGHTSGLAMPNLSLDIPGGGGKVPLVPNFETQQVGTSRFYKGWDGLEGEYQSPPLSDNLVPTDVNEW